MNILLIIAHPDPESFNHAIADAAGETLKKNGHTVWVHDLNAEQFDPILPKAEINPDARLPDSIVQHCLELRTADGIIIVHPNWWGQPPAIMKGWIDRVVRPKIAYEFQEGDSGEGVPIGLLNADSAIIFNTANTSPEREQTVFGDPLERIWRDCVFDLCGVKNIIRRMFTIVITSTEEERKQWLEEVRTITANTFPRHE